MTAIKMITIDLDGTLLRSDGSVSDRTVRTLQAARDKGVVVAIATGRMYQTARPYGERLGLGDSPMLLFAGGLIETLESKKILFQQVIPRETAQGLADLARQQGWQLQTYIDDVLRAARDDEWIRDYERITNSRAVICGDAFYQVQGDCNKLLSRGSHDELVARKALIEKAFPGRFNVLFSASTFLEIMPQGVDKGKGIRRLGELYGVGADEIMALGDSQNDLDMLKAAGVPVAMANAAEEVKAAAAYVTASNDDDGVAAAVEKFVL
ncbi:MAG: Cof-type HAD-IIB family hydrolase [Megasphaera sp.]|uniref:Cof-type HAD-IIB family hydrolase n=1 Tax=Megasphaera sp. TaxID=2023260 RepID=UPI0025BEF488|nr:Cof-type HAD-IIB family hydrolase [Megasphaera sp.]MCI7600103.1 Cof-type HAD-IIB family hydrolase [Megasphaera sp.]